MDEVIYTKETFAARIGIGLTTLEKMMKTGKVKPVRIGRRVLFRKHHVTELLDNCDTSKKRLLKR